jgi:hypothetical protein
MVGGNLFGEVWSKAQLAFEATLRPRSLPTGACCLHKSGPRHVFEPWRKW